MMKKNVLKASLPLLIAGVILAGCGAGTDTQKKSDEAKSGQSVRTVNIVTGATGAPFTYVDKNGELTGYDVEVAKEVDKRTPEIEFKWNKTEFAGMFLGLDADRYQVAVNNIVKNPQRVEKYLFSDNHYLINKNVIAVRNDNKDIKSLDDLAGKKVVTFANGAVTQLFLEDYNKSHPNTQIDLVLSKAEMSEQLKGIQQGLYDATYIPAVNVDDFNKAFSADLKKIDLPKDLQEENNAKVYFVFRKDATDTQKLVDKALESMVKDGTLTKLSMKYFGEDYTK